METPTVTARRTEDFQDREEMRDIARVLPNADENASSDLKRRLSAFSGRVIDFLENMREECVAAREIDDFTERLERNRRRAKAVLDSVIKKDAQNSDWADVVGDDDHAVMNMTHGWSLQAVRTISAHLILRLLSRVKRPFTVRGTGNEKEHQIVERGVTTVLDYLCREARLVPILRHVMRLVPALGTAVVRYEMGVKSGVEVAPNGVLREKDPEPLPSLRIYPLENVLVTDYDKPDAADQRGVFWVRPRATIDDLYEEEARFSVERGSDPETGLPVERPVLAGGKFRNVDALAGGKATASQILGSADTSNPVDSDALGAKVSDKPNGVLVEYEGALPIYQWAVNGDIDWEVMSYFNIDFGMDPNPDEPAEVRAWARKGARVTQWRVAYVVEWTGGETETGQEHLLRFEIARGPEMQNSMYVFAYEPDGTKFLRRSVTDLGKNLENAADTLLNNEMWVAMKNAHPAWVANRRLLKDRSNETIQKLIREPDAIVDGDFPPGVSARDVVQALFLQGNTQWENEVSHLQFQYQQSVGASAAAQGTDTAPGTKTLGEIQINEGKSDMALSVVVENNAMEIARLVEDMFRDAMFFFGPETVMRLIEQLSATTKSDLESVRSALLNADREIDISHPALHIGDPVVLASFLMQAFQVFGPAVFKNPDKLAVSALEAAGLPFAEDLIQGSEAMEPEDETEQMALGNAVQPNPMENVAKHIVTHRQSLVELRQQALAIVQAAESGDPEAEATLSALAQRINMTEKHLEDTVEMMMVLAKAQPFLGMMNGMAPGGGSDQMQGGPRPNENVPEGKPDGRAEEKRQEKREEGTK